MEAGLFLHVVAIVLSVIFLAAVIIGIVAAAILFNLRPDRQSPPFRVPRKEDD
jgi:MFS superfamily sulfate permease-like transporter